MNMKGEKYMPLADSKTEYSEPLR